MLDSFFDSICRVGIFVICARTIVHFKPKEVYDKYLRYLVSIMVLIQLFLPIGSFLLGGGGESIRRALKQFEIQLQESMELAEENAGKALEKLESMTLEEVKRQMEAEKAGVQEQQEQVSGEIKKEIEVEAIDPIIIGD